MYDITHATPELFTALAKALGAIADGMRDAGEHEDAAILDRAAAALEAAREDTKRLDYIEHKFSGMTNRERYLPVQMIWGKGCNGRTLREACDKYRKRDAATDQ